MDEKYTDLAVHVQEIDSRCKSNEHRICDHDKAINEFVMSVNERVVKGEV